MTSVCPAPWLDRHYPASSPLRAGPPLCLAVLNRLRCVSACGSPSCDQGATITHFNWPTVPRRQVLLFHASPHDELTPPLHRAPPGQQAGSPLAEGTPIRARLCPGGSARPRFRCHRSTFRCVSGGSLPFVFSSHTWPAGSGPFPASPKTPALDRRPMRWFGAPACTAVPKGQTFMTGTARFVPAIFYIAFTPLSGSHRRPVVLARCKGRAELRVELPELGNLEGSRRCRTVPDAKRAKTGSRARSCPVFRRPGKD